MSAHTPGPWTVETVTTSCGVCHKVGPWPHEWRGGKMMHACIYDDYPPRPEGTDIMRANARLIAAAPEMLEALRVMTALTRLRFGNSDADVYGQIQKAEAAISKAEGRTS
jgi:hypothetical protein